MQIYTQRQNTHILWRIYRWTSCNRLQQVLVMHKVGDIDVKYSCNLNTVLIESYSSQMPVAAHNRHAPNALNALDTRLLSNDHKCLQGHKMGTVPLNDKSSYHQIPQNLKDKILMFGFCYFSWYINVICHQILLSLSSISSNIPPLESIEWRTGSNATYQR